MPPWYDQSGGVYLPLLKLDAVGWALMSSDNSEKISSNTPLSHQRRQRLWRVVWGPSAARASTQRRPFCMTGMMPRNTLRSSTRPTTFERIIPHMRTVAARRMAERKTWAQRL